MSTAVLYSLFNVCQWLTLNRLLFVFQCIHCCFLNSDHRLSVPNTLLSVGSVNMTSAVYSLFTVCQYLTLYHLLVLSLCPLLSSTFYPMSFSTSHYTFCFLVFYHVHCSLLHSLLCLSVPYIVPSVCSVSLCPLLSPTVCLLSVGTWHWTVCCFFVTMSIAVFSSLSTSCSYRKFYFRLVLSFLLPLSSLCPLSVCTPHRNGFGSVSLYPQESSTVCSLFLITPHCSVCFPVSLRQPISSTVPPQSVSSSHCTICWFCVTMFADVFYNMSTVCYYLKFYPPFFLCHYIHCSLLQSVHCQAAPYVYWAIVTVSTALFNDLSTLGQFLTPYRLLILCHCVYYGLLHSLLCLSVPHTAATVFFSVTMSTSVFYSFSAVC